MDSDKWIAIAVSALLAFGIAAGWYLGWLPSTLFASVVLGIMATGILGVWIWALKTDIERRLHRAVAHSPIILQLPAKPEFSEDRKAEILESHREDYLQRVLVPLAGVVPTSGRPTSGYLADPVPWDNLYLRYDPISRVPHRTDIEDGLGFDAHLRNDIDGYDRDFEKLGQEVAIINEDVTDWEHRLQDRVGRAISAFAPLDLSGSGSPGPFVGLGTSERRLVRIWRDIAYPQLKGGSAHPALVWPSDLVLVPVEIAPGTTDVWTCEQASIARPPPGKSIMDLQSILAGEAKEPALFREYVSLRKRRQSVDEEVTRLRTELKRIIATVERREYRAVLRCCREMLGPPLQESQGGGALGNSIGVVLTRPAIRVEPLEHWKGRTIFLEQRGKIKNDESLPDESSARQTKSNAGAWETTESQQWDCAEEKITFLRYPKHTRFNSKTIPLIDIKFGVLRVWAVGASISDCEATVRFRPIKDPSGTRAPGGLQNVGRLDWFDKGIKVAFLKNKRFVRKLADRPAEGPYRYTRRMPLVSINENTWKDLPLFFTVNKHPAVFLWGPHPGLAAGRFVGKQMVKFEVEVSISAPALPNVISTFLVTARPDEFTITRTG
jgi:hypothetical protein